MPKHIRAKLMKKGRFCFYIKHSMINVTPNALEIEDEKKIKEIFKSENNINSDKS